MTTSNDVAAYICERIGPQGSWTMHKLVFYAHAWSLVWDGTPLVADGFQAWRDGPVSPVLRQRGPGAGDAQKLSPESRATIDAVIAFYGSRSTQELIDLTHKEAPWRDARGDLPPTAHSSAPIPDDGIRSYYSKYGIARKTFSPEFQDSIDLLLLTPDEVLRDGDTTVDGESFMTWLETGEGESWENAEGSGG